MGMQQGPELWIGLVELRPLDRMAYGAAGVFTNIIIWATDAQQFSKKAETIAATMNLYVAGVEEAESLAERTAKRDLTEELEDMVSRAESNPNAIVYGTFHLYRFDDA
jgi:hypothetical protein